MQLSHLRVSSASYPPAPEPQEASGVAFIYKHHGSILLRQVADSS